VTVLSHLVGVGILVLGTYRAFRIRRALAEPIYRTRAFSLALVAILYIIVLVTDLWPSPNYTDLGTATLITLGVTLPYNLFAFMIFVSADRTVLVAIDMDLLQRNTLRWPQLRLPLYAVMFGAVALILVANPFTYLLNTPDWATTALLAYYPIFLTPLSVSVIALFLSAVRSLEKTMRNFVIFFGAAFLCFLFDFVLYNYVTYFVTTSAGQIADDLAIVAATSFLYLAIISITPLGKVEPEAPIAT
jgi:hypothetical protein